MQFAHLITETTSYPLPTTTTQGSYQTTHESPHPLTTTSNTATITIGSNQTTNESNFFLTHVVHEYYAVVYGRQDQINNANSAITSDFLHMDRSGTTSWNLVIRFIFKAQCSLTNRSWTWIQMPQIVTLCLLVLCPVIIQTLLFE